MRCLMLLPFVPVHALRGILGVRTCEIYISPMVKPTNSKNNISFLLCFYPQKIVLIIVFSPFCQHKIAMPLHLACHMKCSNEDGLFLKHSLGNYDSKVEHVK